jgi:Golgi nucleoside diphosphatase
VKKAIEYIPAEKQANTPIYLKATAGMRLLPTEEREAIIEAVINYFSDKSQVPFKFDPRRGAQVIPGEDEGVYGWLTVNALDGRLNRLDKTTTVYPMTAAALDLGGASTQITFEPRFAPLDHAYRSRINGTVHTLYTHSYLRLGADVALQRYAESLVKKGVHVKGGEVNDPCNFRGFVNEVKLSDGRQVKLRGTGQFHQCRKLIRTWLLGLNSFCAAPPCAINGIHSPNIPNDMPIYAISSYYFSTQDLGCGKPGTLSCVMNAAQKKCSLPASQADQAFPSSGPFVKNVCFNNALLIELLSAYHISPDHPIHFVSEINNSETNWSLGAMIDEVNELAYLE